MFEGEAHGAQRVLVADHSDAGQARLIDGEGQHARHFRQKRIAQRAGTARIALAPPRSERAGGVVKAVRLRTPYPRLRRQRPGGQIDPGDEPAAAHTADELVRVQPLLGQRLENLQPRRALPGDDVGMVKGRDDHRAGGRADLLRDLFAAFSVAIVEPQRSAPRDHAALLDTRRVGRHHDGRLHAQKLRRLGHALGMIA